MGIGAPLRFGPDGAHADKRAHRISWHPAMPGAAASDARCYVIMNGSGKESLNAANFVGNAICSGAIRASLGR